MTLEQSLMALDVSSRRDALAIDDTGDEMDRTLQSGEREFAVRTLEYEYNKRREIKAALQRLRLSTFGSCLDCEEEISPRRLAAVPWAALCICCQEQADRCLAVNKESVQLAMAA